jgi:hypothetical protein
MSTLHGMAFLSLAVSWLRLCGVPTEMTIQTDWGEEWGGSNPDKIARLEAEFLRPLGAQLGRIPLGRKAYNGRVERSHRTDDEEFYLPCVLSLDTVEAFLDAGLGWLYYYNYERVHSGYEMAGRTPYGCCVALGFSGFGICRFDACSVIGQYSVRLVASRRSSCQRCVDPLQRAGKFRANSGQFAPSLRGERAFRYNFPLMERATLLLEIGCEEMPAAFMRGTLEQLQAKLAETLHENRLEHGVVRTLGTPRRLIALVEAVATQQTPEERVVRGPAKRACYDAQGNPTPALIGFARSRGVEPDAVQFQKTPQGEYAYVREYDAGQPAVEVLADALPKLILSMTFPKTLRWGSRKMRFGRPIRWIVAMLGQAVIPFELEGIPSGRHSRGHRFMSPEPFEVESPEAFLEQLRRAHVIADLAERERIIIDGATRLAHTIGAHAVLEPDLVEENVFLVEQPHLLLGASPNRFCGCPRLCWSRR